MNLRIGILSTASIVPRFIGAVRAADAALSKKLPSQKTIRLTVAAIASRDLSKAQEKADLWKIPKAYGSYEELLCSPETDAVYIAAINSEHAHLTRLALQAGKHVFCEKPFALDASKARELFALARQKKLFLMEMQKVVFLPVMQELKRRIQNGELGTIRMADFSSSFDPGYNGWFFDAQKGGGPLYGNAGYSLQLMQYLLDCHPDRYTGLSTQSPSGVEDQFSVVFHMENGTLFTNKTSTAANTVHTGYLYGEKGYAEIPEYWKARKAIVHFPDREDLVLSYPCDYELMYEILHAADCIRRGLLVSPVMTEEVTVRTIETLSGLHALFEKA